VCTGGRAEIERLERERDAACEQRDEALVGAARAEAREESLHAKVVQLAALLYGDSSERRRRPAGDGEEGADGGEGVGGE
jgi:hypothetical protein